MTETSSSETIASPPAELEDYYTRQHAVEGDGAQTIYGIWERGQALNDSVTPSTYVEEYRSHIVLKLLSLTSSGSRVFSLGCGNGFVEGDLAGLDRQVRAIDQHAEAVELTRRRQVDAFVADYYDLQVSDLIGEDVIYADGFLGHVFDPVHQIEQALGQLRSLAPVAGTYVVLSNDAPRDLALPYAPHERVPGFWFISRHFLDESLARFGFEPVESYYFPYLRPVSGLRNRTICIARAT